MAQPFVIQRLIQAPQQLLWEVLTQARHLPHWFGPTGSSMPHRTLDLRVGGQFHYSLQMPDGQLLWGQWHLQEVEAPHRLVLVQHFSDAHGGITRHPHAPQWPLQTWSITTLEAEGEQTLLTIHWEPYLANADEVAAFEAGFDSMQQGWGGSLDVLQAYVARLQSRT